MMCVSRVILQVVLIGLGIGFIGSCEEEKPNIPDKTEVVKYNPIEVERGNPMNIYVHYMPWFEDSESSANGSWGIHWTMSTRNPDIVDENGKREIASHYYPLIGPYASGDRDVLEYHLLLMKYSGISGVLLDWYGASDVFDYPDIRQNSEALIALTDDVGLDFAIVYEDRTVDQVLAQSEASDPYEVARTDMKYLEDNYFSNDQYIKINHKPLLMVFGPEKFHTPDDWDNIFSGLTTNLLFLTLNGTSSQTAPHSAGEYIWVNTNSLDYWYSRASRFDYFMGGAYPGFNDYYLEGGWGEGFSWDIDYADGSTFTLGLQKAKQNSMDYLQLITWNDFGEGTMIEPTLEFGFTFLESVQEFAEIDYNVEELEYIHKQYLLRKEKAGNAELQKKLDQCFYYFVSLQTEDAKQLIDSLESL